MTLKAFDDHFYGSVSRSVGEIDLDRFPYFVVEVDKADGEFALGTDPAGFGARMSPPESDGWQRWRLEADVKIDSLARLTLNLHRATAKSVGESWWDGITVRATPMAE